MKHEHAIKHLLSTMSVKPEVGLANPQVEDDTYWTVSNLEIAAVVALF
jgi:hypothetical protein